MARPRGVLSRSWFPFILVLGFVFFVFLADTFRLFEAQELGFIDLRFRLRGPETPHSDIVVVEIDDQSIQRIGHWPWPRSYHATLLSALSSYRPRVILYDVLFTEASTQPSDDELLAYAIRKVGNLILAFFFNSVEPFSAVFPLASYQQAAKALGYVNIYPDSDGHVRRIRAFIYPKEGVYYHTSIATILSAFPKETGQNWLDRIPVDRQGDFWVNFPGPFYQFPRVPFYRIIEEEGKNDPEFRKLLAGKIIVVGQTATGSGDFRPTPLSAAYPGVGIQASALHTLLTGQYLHRLEGWAPLGILLLLALLTVFLTRTYPPFVALTAVFLLTGFYLVWNFFVFSHLGWILPVFPILLTTVCAYVFTLLLQYLQVRFEGELLSRELLWAARIQENFLPHQTPQMPGLEIGFHCQFAQMVGGDLYDWVPLGESRIGICVGDVSGKGVPAALYMARVISEWRSLAKDFDSASQLVSALNQRLVSISIEGLFVTFLYLILDLGSKTISFSNAGHEPLFFYKSGERQAEWIRRASSQPLGLFSETTFTQETLSIGEGDFVVLISDGVRELRNLRGEEWGLGGMEKAFDSFPLESAEQIVKQLFNSMDEFSRGAPAHDDRTVLCVKVGEGGK